MALNQQADIPQSEDPLAFPDFQMQGIVTSSDTVASEESVSDSESDSESESVVKDDKSADHEYASPEVGEQEKEDEDEDLPSHGKCDHI